jgi:pyruvate formate lyase activating enzyme
MQTGAGSLIGDSDTVAARWWRDLGQGRIQCDLCPRLCKLRPGQRGFCFVRQNIGGQMALTTYGRSSGFCVDPIEKKPLNHFYPGTSVLSFGTAGCNLGCRFCQNWDISRAGAYDRLAERASPEAIALTARKWGCRSVAFTYNDPVIFAEYAMDVADACRENNIAPIAVTAGYINREPREDFYRHIDAANVDLKGFTDAFYHRHCLGALTPVLETLTYLRHSTQVWLEVTTLLIPEENDSERELEQAADWFATHLGPEVPWHFTAFHPDYKMLDKPNTPASTLTRARAIARARGLRYVYTGNVRDPEGSSTWCPGCGRRLIARDGYDITEWHLDGHRCAECGFAIAGQFGEQPGQWGNRRQTVHCR